MKKVYTEQVVNHCTGEVTKTTNVYERYSKSSNFIFLDADSHWFADLMGCELKLMISLVMIENKNTRRINITKDLKDELSRKLDICVNQIEKAIRSLIKKDKLKRLSKGVYMVNPSMLWIGDTKTKHLKQEEYDNH